MLNKKDSDFFNHDINYYTIVCKNKTQEVASVYIGDIINDLQNISQYQVSKKLKNPHNIAEISVSESSLRLLIRDFDNLNQIITGMRVMFDTADEDRTKLDQLSQEIMFSKQDGHGFHMMNVLKPSDFLDPEQINKFQSDIPDPLKFKEDKDSFFLVLDYRSNICFNLLPSVEMILLLQTQTHKITC